MRRGAAQSFRWLLLALRNMGIPGRWRSAMHGDEDCNTRDAIPNKTRRFRRRFGCASNSGYVHAAALIVGLGQSQRLIYVQCWSGETLRGLWLQ
jgi:hypothetical protein